MRILYIGEEWGTSLHRARALTRLGHDVEIFNPAKLLPKSKLMALWLHRTGALGCEPFIVREVMKQIDNHIPELVWLDQGILIGANVVKAVKRRNIKVVNYIIDDPFRRGREWMRFRLCRQAMPFVDLVAVCRQENIYEAKAIGTKKVMKVWRSADEIVHRPRELSPDQYTKYVSDVCFIGTWFPERGPFMAELIARGVPLSIWGDRWHKAREWPLIKPHWRGGALYGDDDYAAAISASKICLGLLSKGNRDLHTTRSMEIPALGGLFCAERTSEHLELYRDGEEAVFWRNAAECAEQCKALLADKPRRRRIAAAGHQRALKNGHYNEQVMAQILHELESL
jgi:spore maturation protein CgeB